MFSVVAKLCGCLQGSPCSTVNGGWMQCGARAATADPRCSCQRDSPYNSHDDDDPGAHGHGQVGAKQNERGQTMRWAVGMAWQRRAGTQSPQNKAAAGGHSRRTICPAQASKKQNSQQLAGLAAKQQLPTKLAGLSLCSAGWWRECGGAGHSTGGLRPTYPVPTPPIAFACHCTYPLP